MSIWVVESGTELRRTLGNILETVKEFAESLSGPQIYQVSGGLACVRFLVTYFQQTSAELLVLAHQAHRLGCPLVHSYVSEIRELVEDSLKEAESVIAQLSSLTTN